MRMKRWCDLIGKIIINYLIFSIIISITYIISTITNISYLSALSVTVLLPLLALLIYSTIELENYTKVASKTSALYFSGVKNIGGRLLYTNIYSRLFYGQFKYKVGQKVIYKGVVCTIICRDARELFNSSRGNFIHLTYDLKTKTNYLLAYYVQEEELIPDNPTTRTLYASEP